MKFIILDKDEDIGKRLDLCLAIKLSDFSRKNIKALIEANKVLINGEICFKAGHKVKPGDEIEIPVDQIMPRGGKIQSLRPSEFDLPIIFEDEDYLIIDKPSGILVHPANQYQNDTVVNKLISKYQALPYANSSSFRPGIVHRLDKATSGLLIIAKTSKALWWISKAFAERKVKKTYISIGVTERKDFQQEFSKESYLARSVHNRKVYISYENQDAVKFKARFAKTSFKLLSINNFSGSLYAASFVVIPATGRTHQIRVHQKDVGAPILGDELYLSDKMFKICSKELIEKGINPRLFLHSWKVEFLNYDGSMYRFATKIPLEFKIIDEKFTLEEKLET